MAVGCPALFSLSGGPVCRPYEKVEQFPMTTLIRLAALGTFPLEGGRLLGGHTGPPLRADRNISERAGEDTRPYGSKRTGSVGSVK